MKFKLKQPTKYMHEVLEDQDKDQSGPECQNRIQQKNASSTKHSTYKNKKIIKKKHEPSAQRLNKINQTFENIYNNSASLFKELNVDIDQLDRLSQIETKQKCLCNKNVKFYCLKCMQKVCKQPFPSIQLPFQISVIHHQSQKVNKSSAIPLQFLTKQVKIHFFSSLSENKNQKLWQQLPKPGKGVFILFPHKQSKLVEQIFGSNRQDSGFKIQSLIILDCTWFQTDQILQILKRKGYNQFVRIQGYKSLYWRYNHHNDEALCSAQAIAFFMRQFQKSKLKITNQNEIKQENQQKQIRKYDNLLFIYCLNLKMIVKGEEQRIQASDAPIQKTD